MSPKSPEAHRSNDTIQRLDDALVAERAARDRAEEANRRKDAFLAILSHEMRSPLNSVLTWVEVLRSERLPAATRRQALDAIERSARLQTRMIEDLLDSSRIISGRLSLELQGADLVTIVRGAVEAASAAAAEKRISLECRLDPASLPIHADPVRLQQIVGNLLSNAIKFTPSEGRISVELRCDGGTAEIRVSDTGCGIAPEILPHVFEPFRQGDSSITRRHSGLGLGLAIAKHLTALHGGMIAAESDGVDRGSTFAIRLPMPRQTLHSVDSPEEGERSQSVLRGLDVLVVDDHADSLQALTVVLAAAGSQVRRAESASEAIRAFDAQASDVVITDLAMPDQDGYAVIRALHDRNPKLPVIAFTAAAGNQDRARVRKAGFCLHLTKPLEPSELREAVAMAATGRAAEFSRKRS